jgi:hypothetical protein
MAAMVWNLNWTQTGNFCNKILNENNYNWYYLSLVAVLQNFCLAISNFLAVNFYFFIDYNVENEIEHLISLNGFNFGNPRLIREKIRFTVSPFNNQKIDLPSHLYTFNWNPISE